MLVKVDSANRHGILLEMVQVLTDLDLIISKSYISSDGGWLIDVFHVTDQYGNKLTDQSHINYIQKALAAEMKGGEYSPEVKTCLGNLVGCNSDNTTLEMTAKDRPGLLSEVTAVLAELNCDVYSGVAWTHKDRAACILYISDSMSGRPIDDLSRLARVQEQIESVVEAHHCTGELHRVGLFSPSAGCIRTERRLHQLMREDKEYEAGPRPPPIEDDNLCTGAKGWFGHSGGGGRSCSLPIGFEEMTTRVSIDCWKERDYSVVNMQSWDRPKLFFDTICTLTDLQYEVFHAFVSTHGSVARQEYYIRHMDGRMLESEVERGRVIRSLVAAIERRVGHGLKVEVRTMDRQGLLAEVTRALRKTDRHLIKQIRG